MVTKNEEGDEDGRKAALNSSLEETKTKGEGTHDQYITGNS
jgi:hypothetical protein